MGAHRVPSFDPVNGFASASCRLPGIGMATGSLCGRGARLPLI